MKIDRYKMHPRFDAVELVIDPDGSVCYTRDVAKLEALNAELLEAAEAVVARWDSPAGEWRNQKPWVVFIDQLRAAIVNAKGEGV